MCTVYFFVTSDGSEAVSNELPQRAVPYIEEHAPIEGGRFTRSCDDALRLYMQNGGSGWFTGIDETDYGEYVPGEDFICDWTYLPKGTIKTLTGKKLTYSDDPIKLES